jgi:hypothetical protein
LINRLHLPRNSRRNKQPHPLQPRTVSPPPSPLNISHPPSSPPTIYPPHPPIHRLDIPLRRHVGLQMVPNPTNPRSTSRKLERIQGTPIHCSGHEIPAVHAVETHEGCQYRYLGRWVSWNTIHRGKSPFPFFPSLSPPSL